MKIVLPATVRLHGDGRKVRADVLVPAGSGLTSSDVLVRLLVDRGAFVEGPCDVTIEQRDDADRLAEPEEARPQAAVPAARELTPSELHFMRT